MLVNLTTCEIWDNSLTYSHVPIVLTSYHKPKTFKRCVDSLLSATRQHIYIIDNSQGHIDKELLWAEKHQTITIYRNDKNIGKPSSIRKHASILKNSRWFVTMDPDVIIPPNGIDNLISTADKLCQDGYQIGLVVPALIQNNRSWDNQLRSKNLVMHNWDHMHQISPNIFYNHALAGCLMLVNTLFYNNIGGFTGTRLYNDDDGWLCNQSIKNGLMNIIDGNIICEHDITEESIGYIEWKKSNSIIQRDLKGYLD